MPQHGASPQLETASSGKQDAMLYCVMLDSSSNFLCQTFVKTSCPGTSCHPRQACSTNQSSPLRRDETRALGTLRMTCPGEGTWSQLDSLQLLTCEVKQDPTVIKTIQCSRRFSLLGEHSIGPSELCEFAADLCEGCVLSLLMAHLTPSLG